MDILTKVLAAVSCIVCFVMMMHISVDVLMRTFLHKVMLGTYETTQYIYMPMIIIPAFAFTYRCGVLPMFDTLTRKVSSNTQRLIRITVLVIEIIVFLLLARYSFTAARQAHLDLRAVSAGGRMIPTWWIFYFLPVSFCIMLIDCIVERLIQIIDWKHTEKVLAEEGAAENAAVSAFSAEITDADNKNEVK